MNHPDDDEIVGDDIIGYDTSAYPNALSVLCVDCGTEGEGTPIHRGEDWGGYAAPCCATCGEPLDVTVVGP
jgi:hypothetical protein